MTAKVIKGMEVRQSLLSEIKAEVAVLKEKYHMAPGLVTILVGKNPASMSYVSLKIKTANELGFHEIQENQPETISEENLLKLIEYYNMRDDVHGILVQLPLPGHINSKNVINTISPDKDVDAFHPVNAGRLMLNEDVKFYPCTPAGIIEILRRNNIKTQGAEVVIVGRSNIVGKPLANMLMQKGPFGNATVTVVHTQTADIKAHCLRADILIAAVGQPEFVKADWIKPGACVIDVGVNRVGEKTDAEGKVKAVLKGDVEYAKALDVAGYITPVPGGVGPMTIAMLMQNTLNAFKYKLKEPVM